MAKDKNENDKVKYEGNDMAEDKNEYCSSQEQSAEESDKGNETGIPDALSILKAQLEEKDKELKQYIELAQRVKAEFDNYKKRSAREREQLYSDINGSIILELLPVIDNLDRAVSSEAQSSEGLYDGVKMIIKQFTDILVKQGLEEISALGEEFNPEYHNAVMHIEDESYGPNTVAEVFQKGYKVNDRVIRHSVVKVAN